MWMTKSVHFVYEAGACANTDVSEFPNHAAASEHGAGVKWNVRDSEVLCCWSSAWLFKARVSVFPNYEGYEAWQLNDETAHAVSNLDFWSPQ